MGRGTGRRIPIKTVLSEEAFRGALDLSGLDHGRASVVAAWEVLVQGAPLAQAGRDFGISRQSVGETVDRIRAAVRFGDLPAVHGLRLGGRLLDRLESVLERRHPGTRVDVRRFFPRGLCVGSIEHILERECRCRRERLLALHYVGTLGEPDPELAGAVSGLEREHAEMLCQRYARTLNSFGCDVSVRLHASGLSPDRLRHLVLEAMDLPSFQRPRHRPTPAPVVDPARIRYAMDVANRYLPHFAGDLSDGAQGEPAPGAVLARYLLGRFSALARVDERLVVSVD